MPTTLALVSACRVFHDDKAGRISTQGLASAVKCLIPESQGEWHITIASQVKLWAPQHHQDIGWATAHPDLWDWSRHDSGFTPDRGVNEFLEKGRQKKLK